VAIALALTSLIALVKKSRVLATVLLIGACVSLGGDQIPALFRWAWTLLLVPVAMIVDQAAFAAMVRRLPFPNESDKAFLPSADQTRASEAVLQQAQSARDRFFRFDTLSLRYGLPALFIMIVGTAYTALLCTPEPACCGLHSGTELFLAARLGLAGAYVYVILYLGQRAFRHDITSGAAMWSVATIALGPLLAAVTSLVVNPEAAITGSNSAGAAVSITKAALYFVAGLAPRHVAAFVQESVRRLLPTTSSETGPRPRLLPLLQIRGITPDIEVRLAEEGVVDGYGLAMADPFQLMRATNFDKRQILGWIDEAILALALPDGWQKLEAVGITGAIDLAAQYYSITGSPAAVVPAVNVAQAPEVAELAQQVGVSPGLMASLMRRLSQDMQVQIVWTLYQTPSEGDETVIKDDQQPRPETGPAPTS
jgi:hypothetical protein